MQSVWTRVARFGGSCRCPQCSSAVSGVARRSALSAGQSVPRYSTTSTLWLSGIFAAAATFDAGVKERRRAQWDNAIATLKHDVHGESDVAAEQREAEDQKDRSEKMLEEVQSFWKSMTADLGASLDSSAERLHNPVWPVNTGHRLDIHNLPPQSIYASTHHKSSRTRAVWTPKKLERMQLAMDILQLEIIKEIQTARQIEEAAQSVPEDYRKTLALAKKDVARLLAQKKDDIRRLKSVNQELEQWSRTRRDVSLSCYAQDDAAKHRHSTRSLNTALQDLYVSLTNGNLTRTSWLAKVSYNISASRSPPDVDTYNTLILGFWLAKESRMAMRTIDSFFVNHVRPNEVSLAAILGFYADRGETEKFGHVLKLMRGKQGGLMAAKSDVQINESGETRLLKRSVAQHKVVQLPYPTPLVFNTLVNGVLKFSGFETALTVCKTMSKEGWGLCMSGMTPLLHDCERRGDLNSGMAIFRQMQMLEKQAMHGEKIGIAAYVSLLRLCAKEKKEALFHRIMALCDRTHQVTAQSRDIFPKRHDTSAIAWNLLTSETKVSANASISKMNAENNVSREAVVIERPTNQMETSPNHAHLLETASPKSMSSLGPSEPARSTMHDKKVESSTTTRHAYKGFKEPQLERHQLLGFAASSDTLNEYEIYERPMQLTMSAAAG